MSTRKFKCIGLKEVRNVCWSKYFKVGEIYEESDNPIEVIDTLSLITKKSKTHIGFDVTWYVDKSQFEEVVENKNKKK